MACVSSIGVVAPLRLVPDREDAAAGAELDEVGAVSRVLTDQLAAGVDTVGGRPHALLDGGRDEHVAMPCRHADEAADDDARAGKDPLLHHVPHGDLGSSTGHIAHADDA